MKMVCTLLVVMVLAGGGANLVAVNLSYQAELFPTWYVNYGNDVFLWLAAFTMSIALLVLQSRAFFFVAITLQLYWLFLTLLLPRMRDDHFPPVAFQILAVTTIVIALCAALSCVAALIAQALDSRDYDHSSKARNG